jgi:hypothetical protein
VSAHRTTLLFNGDFVKFKFVVSFIALSAFWIPVVQSQEKQTDWGSVGGGYLYQLSESTTGHWTSTHGWYVLPTFNINKQIGVFADSANLYSNDDNVHADFFGVLHGFENRTKVTPFIFTGPGYVRVSDNRTISHSFAWCGGGGFVIPISQRVSFQAIPIEYVVNTANGNVGNNIVARAGFAITIPKRRRSGK